jgi:prepilin-type N-terminal cleavage/methylation domain-containing protein
MLRKNPRSESFVTRGGQGFSVIELLVAISILSVLLFIASSTLGELAPKFALDNTVRSVARALNQARSQAITRGHTVDVTFAAHSYEITDATDGDAVLATDELSALVGVSTGDVVTFTPLGMAAAPLTITVSNGSNSRTVEIGITGEVMIQ